MKPVLRSEILDYVTYGERRERIQRIVMEEKRRRRVHLGNSLTFLFENRDTIRYQIQEMLRVEKIVKEVEIQREIDTFNELLGDEGELGATLLIEIEDPERRDTVLREWRALPAHLYLKTENDEKIYARFDSRQVGTDRLSSVQYLKFGLQGKVPSRVGSDFPGLKLEAELDEEQRKALEQDLRMRG